jgi:serine/threonine protein kinase
MGGGSREAVGSFDFAQDKPLISDRAIDRLREAAAWPELDARYEITSVAGRGGMGTVYIARDHVLERDVAVKVLDVADQKGSRAARLQREANILARLDHPAIVPIHDAGTLPDGRTFYVMKLVRGRRLDDLVRAGEPLANRLNAFSRILDAVAFAHAQGIVHRDLKPANVMVGAFGEVYVMDWGVAQGPDSEGDLAVVGTPGFMPPEQELARARVDARADVFALGAMLSHLAGEAPPPALTAIADKARHRDIERRYQDVPALAADLARFRNQDPVAAYRESFGERAVRLYRRYELPILLLLAYIVMRFALLVFRGV